MPVEEAAQPSSSQRLPSFEIAPRKLEGDPAPAPGLPVRGILRSQRGAWGDADRLVRGHLRLELLSQDDPGRSFAASLAKRALDSGEEVIAFRFWGVGTGRYELTLSSTDHHRWSPARLELEPPVEDLEIWRLDDRDAIELAFRVLDARTGEPLEGYSAWSVRTEVGTESGVLFHAGPLKLQGVPPDAPFHWRLWATGYVPTGGDERDFLEEADGRWVAEVRLRPGWGRRFVALGRDPTMRPLPGARIALDGREVGRTDADGVLDVTLDAPPGAVEATWGALHLAPRPVPAAAEAAGRAQVSVLVLEAPGSPDDGG